MSDPNAAPVDTSDTSDDSSLASPPVNQSPQDFAKAWLNKIDLAQKEEKDWRSDCKEIWDIYVPPAGKKGKDYNILFSNTEVLLPSLYSATPKSDVRRRFGDKDPVGKIASMALERCLDYEIDAYDFDHEIECAVLDGLITGRGLARIRYVPTIQPMQGADGQPVIDPTTGAVAEELTDEDVLCDYVKWRDFARSPGKVWSDVTWVAFRSRLKKEELLVEFANIDPEKVSFDYETAIDGDDETYKNADESAAEKADKRVTIWEIWDKIKKQVIYLAPSYQDGPLKTQPDPLELKQFFPIPRPLQFILSTNSLVPVPEYKQYEKQAKQLNEISRRILYITKALKVRGIYDSTLDELQRLFDSDDNQMIPADNVADLYDKGGIEKSIWMMPIQEAANVLNILYQQQNTCQQSIYDISGISDIMRGESKASETLGAQQLKANFGSVRLKRKSRELQRFIRDILRLKAEVISQHFQPQTIVKIANITPQDLQLATAGMPAPPAPPPQPGQPPQPPAPPPPVTLDQVGQLLKDQELRMYRIGIQTDSTVADQDQESLQTLNSFMQGLNQFFAMTAPAVQSGALPPEAAKLMLTAYARKFKMGEMFEEALDQLQAPPPKQPDPIKMGELQVKNKKVTGDLALGSRKLDIESGKVKDQTATNLLKTASDHVNKGHQAIANVASDIVSSQNQPPSPPPGMPPQPPGSPQ